MDDRSEKGERMKKISIRCSGCPATATDALTLRSDSNRLVIPLCASCVRPFERWPRLRIRTEALPSHEPVIMGRADRFPPKKGEWFQVLDGDLILGCPLCGAVVGVGATHRLEDRELKPSYICPMGCGAHVWLTLSPAPTPGESDDPASPGGGERLVIKLKDPPKCDGCPLLHEEECQMIPASPGGGERDGRSKRD
jgi:hypothetical protein